MSDYPIATSLFVQQFDEVPEFWQYLQGLSRDDLITELVQNELDAQSTHTRIVFHPDKLICEGNGVSVDADGWKRLSFVRGAGDLAPRKLYQLGVKNHGLKACFTIGDEIHIQSDGKQTIQTLYMNGADVAPSPGAYPRPVSDIMAPTVGCRVTVPYRTMRLRPGNGEVFDFDVPSQESLARLFQQACDHAPERFIGALVPGIRKEYTLDIVHHLMGNATFRFSCSFPRGKKTKPYFRRKCEISGDLPNLSSGIVLREQCYRWTVQRPEGIEREIPKFYASTKNRFFIEIAWTMTSRGIPISQAGRRRYPIAYTLDSDTALTGMGVNVSAPYVSDPERHGTAPLSDFNSYVDRCARKKLIALLRKHIVPEHGPGALNLLYDPGRVPKYLKEAGDDPLVPLINELLDSRAVPLANALNRSSRQNRSRKKSDVKVRLFGPRIDKIGNPRRILIPVLTWEQKINESLTSLCPPQEDVIHPSVPYPIVERLMERACEGWKTIYVTFDERDVADRWIANKEAYFPWDSDAAWQTEFSDPRKTRVYMDVVFKALENKQKSLLDDALVKNLQCQALVPDSEQIPRRVEELYAGKKLPSNLPLADAILVLNPELSEHRLWRKKDWRRRQLTFDEFVKQTDMVTATLELRESFWEWLAANHSKVSKRSWPRLAKLPVWPDCEGEFHPIDTLCLPRSARTRSVLKESLHLPHACVLALPDVKRAKRGTLVIRQRPYVAEVERFFEVGLDRFPRDRRLTCEEIRVFKSIEEKLDILAQDPNVKKPLEELSGHARGLNSLGELRHPSELVQPDRQSRMLYLLPTDILERAPCNLDNLKGWAPRQMPSPEQVIHALRADPQREEALVPRLQSLQNAWRLEERSGEPWGIDDIPCIRLDGWFSAPSEVAFRSKRGEYWGAWRKSIGSSGLSAEAQQLYRMAGVLSGEPTPDTSRAFFEWLQGQSPQVKAKHTTCVLRHWLHKDGPLQWAQDCPVVPVVPVEEHGGMSLISIVTMKQSQNVFIPDHDVAEAIRKKGHASKARLAINRREDVSSPITEQLREVGVMSLREEITSPVQVGCASSSQADNEIYQALETLRANRMKRELRKRLDELDVPSSKLRRNWHDQIRRIGEVKIARELKAAFRICRQRYECSVNATFEAGIDKKKTGIVWIDEKSDVPQKRFFEVMAELIFDRPDRALPILLREAVQREFSEREPYWDTFDSEEEGAPEASWDNDLEVVWQDEGKDSLGETRRTHGHRKQESSAGVPEPGPIPTVPPKMSKSHSNGRGRTSRGNSELRENRSKQQRSKSGRTAVEEEELQIKNLKDNQYAWHCQACLGDYQPDKLAPARSYAARLQNRHMMLVAHHVDQVHSGGARHAGNLLLLCHYHHEHLGDAMSRQEVVRALKFGDQKSQRQFVAGSGRRRSRTVDGLVALVSLPSRNETIEIFFTMSHAGYWLQKAKEDGVETSDRSE